jgi:NAD(P)-dependent dehydrogenase (short-subunit alcohol dehydrogenase family)
LVPKAAVPQMTSRGWGRIIMVASVTGPVMAIRADVGYVSAKAGMVGLTRAVALDAARHGITVNAVAPGWIATGSQTPHERGEGLATPAGRSGTPGEVAAAWPGWPARTRPTSPGNASSWTAAIPSLSSAPRQRDQNRPASLPAAFRWERSWQFSFPIPGTSVRKTRRDGRI